MQTKEVLKNNFKYLNLDLNNIPSNLTNNSQFVFKPSRINTDKENKVYKYIDIRDIQIYLTPHNRDDDIKRRWTDAKPLESYLALFKNKEDIDNLIEEENRENRENRENKKNIEDREGREDRELLEKNDKEQENKNQEEIIQSKESLKEAISFEKDKETLNININLNYEENEKKVEFIKLFENFNVKIIEEIEQQQIEFNKKIPFHIFYPRASMWNIYYDENSKKYAMLVHMKEADFSEMFFLIKKKIELDENNILIQTQSGEKTLFSEEDSNLIIKDEFKLVEETGEIAEILQNEDKKLKDNNVNILNKIYAPINYINLSEQFLDSDEILELENNLWYFTKNWPIVYDVYDSSGKYYIAIVGQTYIYDRLTSDYRFMISKKEEALEVYKLIKALFSLDASTDRYFSFENHVKKDLTLGFRIGESEINYEDIAFMIAKQYDRLYKKIQVLNDENKAKTIKLNSLRKDIYDKEKIYKEKQNEVVIYLECKKSVPKKIKYFFRNTGRIKRKKEKEKQKNLLKEEIEARRKEKETDIKIDYSVIEQLGKIDKKDNYTIEDFIYLYSLFNKINKTVKNLKQDIRASKLMLININNKLANVEIYLDEIEENKRNIFDFWKFTNKDKKLSLEEADQEEIENNTESNKGSNEEKIESAIREKVFNYDMDIESLGKKADQIQRKKLSREELNSIYLATTEFLTYYNMVRKSQIDEYSIVSFVNQLKEEFTKTENYIGESFDIFGTTKTALKTRFLGSEEFREVDRNWIKAFEYNKSIDKFMFLEKITARLKYLDEAFLKIRNIVDLPVYKVYPQFKDKPNEKNFEIFSIDINQAVKEYEGDAENITLVKIDIKKDLPLIYLTNIMFYENNNQTLPVGSFNTSNVLLDLSKLSLEEMGRSNIILNKDNNSRKVDIIEYKAKNI